MRVCTLHLAITLGIRLFSREIIKKYASYCIIACVLTCRIAQPLYFSFVRML